MLNRWFRLEELEYRNTQDAGRKLQATLFALGYRWAGPQPFDYKYFWALSSSPMGIALNFGYYLSTHTIEMLETSMDMIEVKKQDVLSMTMKEFWELEDAWWLPEKEKEEEEDCKCPMTWEGILHIEKCRHYIPPPPQPWAIPKEKEEE
jgi:hypothetical protein